MHHLSTNTVDIVKRPSFVKKYDNDTIWESGCLSVPELIGFLVHIPMPDIINMNNLTCHV